jgi:hypothetical protein
LSQFPSEQPIAETIRELADIIGIKRTALLSGANKTGTVQAWIAGAGEPEKPFALRTALQAAKVIAASDGPAVARAWFSGSNQHFEARAPMVVLRECDPHQASRIVKAALEFVTR